MTRVYHNRSCEFILEVFSVVKYRQVYDLMKAVVNADTFLSIFIILSLLHCGKRYFLYYDPESNLAAGEDGQSGEGMGGEGVALWELEMKTGAGEDTSFLPPLASPGTQSSTQRPFAPKIWPRPSLAPAHWSLCLVAVRLTIPRHRHASIENILFCFSLGPEHMMNVHR